MKNLFRPLLLGTSLAGLLASCSGSDNPTPAPTGAGQYAFVVNEGNFSNGIGSVSKFDKTAPLDSKTMQNDAFASANGGVVLGSVVQSLTVVDQRGYVVVNNSNKIEVVSLPDLKSLATIAGLNQPRYLTRSVANPNRGYVTEWLGGPYPAPYTAGRISLIDLTTNKVTGTVPVGINPGRAVVLNGSVYVPNGGTNSLTVINEASGAATGTVALPSPASEVVADKNGQLWILCGGDYVSQPATLIAYNPTAATQRALPFPSAKSSASGLRISPDGQQLYYSYGGAEYRMSITDPALPTQPLIRRSFYGFDIDPGTGQLYGLDPLNYSNPGKVLRYAATGGKALDSATVQVSPNAVVFY